MMTFVERLLVGTKFRIVVTAAVTGLLIACCLAAMVLFAFTGYMAVVYSGWGSVIPQQIQVTVDRKGATFDEFLPKLAAAAERRGFTVNARYESWSGLHVSLTDKTKTMRIDTGYPSPNIDLALTVFSIVDLKNTHGTIDIARAIGDDLSGEFPATRIYVQVDPQQYDCVKTPCSFEMSQPIEVGKLPRRVGIK
ncbi:MAG: hypothetical protein KA260_00615 [Burkholderiales bacterium]|nr:hypothetical protein [Burkholderiales bacterium]